SNPMSKTINGVKYKAIKKYISKFLAMVFWLGIWLIGCRIIDNKIVLVSPLEVFKTLITLCQSFDFWLTIFHSFSRIVVGLILALITGTVLAVISYWSPFLYELTSP